MSTPPTAAIHAALIERIEHRFRRSLGIVFPIGDVESELCDTARDVVRTDGGAGAESTEVLAAPGLLLVTLLAPQTWSATWFAFELVADDNEPRAASVLDQQRPLLAARRDALRGALHPNGDAPQNAALRARIAESCGELDPETNSDWPRAIGRPGDPWPWRELAEALRTRDDRPRAFGAEAVLLTSDNPVPRAILDATGDLSSNYGLPG